MKKKCYYFAILSVCGLILLTGCNKNQSKPSRPYNSNSNNNNFNYTPSTTPAQTTAIAPENAPTVHLNNLTIMEGAEIDYMSAIESVENMELNKSMVSINSSGVNRFIPGTYTAYYTFDYMGYTVKNSIVVNVLKNPEKETTTLAETIPETSTETVSESSQENTAKETETAPQSESETTSVPEQVENNTSAPTANANGALQATVYDPNLPIPDAVFTLSTGEVITIKNTPERYIVETFTEDVYYTEDNCHYLRSELKVLINTGEIQMIETVITRVNEIPE